MHRAARSRYTASAGTVAGNLPDPLPPSGISAAFFLTFVGSKLLLRFLGTRQDQGRILPTPGDWAQHARQFDADVHWLGHAGDTTTSSGALHICREPENWAHAVTNSFSANPGNRNVASLDDTTRTFTDHMPQGQCKERRRTGQGQPVGAITWYEIQHQVFERVTTGLIEAAPIIPWSRLVGIT